MKKLYFSSNVLNISFSNETNYILLKPGKYLFEAYGASGGGDGANADTTSRIPNEKECLDQINVTKFGGNTKCNKVGSQPGAGGYSRGIFTARSTTPIYVLTGGKGNYGEGERPGGFNGGGSACSTRSSSGSGGGATDFRLFYNSLYSRILVAGGGGGSDDFTIDFANAPYMGANDGSGGSGGLIGQAMWEDGKSIWQTAYPNGAKNNVPEMTLSTAKTPLQAGTVQYLKELGYEVPAELIPPEYVEV